MTTMTVNSDGRITIPAAIRRQLGLTKGSRLHVEQRGDKVFLRVVNTQEPRAETEVITER